MSETEIDHLPSFTFPSADINVLRILPVPEGEVYFNIWVYSFSSFVHPVGGAPGQISFECRE